MSKTSYFPILFRCCGISLLMFAGLQFVRPKLKNPPVSSELQVPPELKAIFKLAILRNYLTPKSQEPPATLSEVQAADREYVRWIEGNGTVRTVQNTLEGVPFHPEYKTWKQIGSTERIENNTIRVVLGNDLALKAIAENHINPWPDGAIIAKATWHEQPDPNGVVQPGEVELMIRDREKYHTTAGWGWGRWIGTDLKPDGHTLDFAGRQCVNCHLAVRRNDYVHISGDELGTLTHDFQSELPISSGFASKALRRIFPARSKRDLVAATEMPARSEISFTDRSFDC
jgi:hypothetical protein